MKTKHETIAPTTDPEAVPNSVSPNAKPFIHHADFDTITVLEPDGECSQDWNYERGSIQEWLKEARAAGRSFNEQVFLKK